MTLYVNLYGGPGSGKSTGAAYIMSKLKLQYVNVELVTEYAKDLVWEAQHAGTNIHPTFSNSLSIFSEQYSRLKRLENQVDVVITDCPCTKSLFYCEDPSLEFENLVKSYSLGLGNCQINIILERVKRYDPNGRMQTEDQASKLDGRIEDFLENTLKVPFHKYRGSESGYMAIFEDILKVIH